ncbi:hypothetical protein [Pasteurella phage vB_PmuP_Pa7]|uniref:Uncharacterized protein n=1 Tax=Pasteurella phage vB_PmuP_Pa7 TaxID=2767198 RepID=A0A7G8ZYN8_9CAUD|nr:hypothetical protein [Pasteurella phage vB_PmuP_Pa7]
MSKQIISQRAFKDAHKLVVGISYGKYPNILRILEATHYNATSLGWRCDMYSLGSMGLTTGYSYKAHVDVFYDEWLKEKLAIIEHKASLRGGDYLHELQEELIELLWQYCEWRY